MFYRILILSAFTSIGLAWNMQGHRVVAQIAFDHLNEPAKQMVGYYLTRNHTKHLEEQFINASTWMDRIKFKSIHWYDPLHYMDIPFSKDHTQLPIVEKINATWALSNALIIIKHKHTNFGDKRLALLIILHVLGDIHQPMHAVSFVSKELPQGDQGGNLYMLGRNRVGKNLHQYWDRGGGLFIGEGKKNHIKVKAASIEQLWPCNTLNLHSPMTEWANESYTLAVNKAYIIKPLTIPSQSYEHTVKDVSQQRIALAGCRLAHVLNNLAISDSVHSIH